MRAPSGKNIRKAKLMRVPCAITALLASPPSARTVRAEVVGLVGASVRKGGVDVPRPRVQARMESFMAAAVWDLYNWPTGGDGGVGGSTREKGRPKRGARNIYAVLFARERSIRKLRKSSSQDEEVMDWDACKGLGRISTLS